MVSVKPTFFKLQELMATDELIWEFFSTASALHTPSECDSEVRFLYLVADEEGAGGGAGGGGNGRGASPFVSMCLVNSGYFALVLSCFQLLGLGCSLRLSRYHSRFVDGSRIGGIPSAGTSLMLRVV